jgi:copper homeostasis protein
MLTFGKLNISNMIVEVCANSLQSSLNAENAGAHRIELCSELGIGGITPSFGLLKKVKEKLSLPVHVLIRPRSGDFTYSDLEFNIMKEDILFCREMGFAGIVSGVLHSDFSLDLSRTGTLVELAGDHTFTFHRAFDWVKDPITTLDQLEKIGYACLLNSGHK